MAALKFTVKRSQWLRGKRDGAGEPEETPELLKLNGHRCCLGFLAAACGFTDEDIQCIGDPDGTTEQTRWPVGFFNEHMEDEYYVARTQSNIVNTLIAANDDETIDDETREGRLKLLFANSGIDVEFVE